MPHVFKISGNSTSTRMVFKLSCSPRCLLQIPEPVWTSAASFSRLKCTWQKAAACLHAFIIASPIWMASLAYGISEKQNCLQINHTSRLYLFFFWFLWVEGHLKGYESQPGCLGSAIGCQCLYLPQTGGVCAVMYVYQWTSSWTSQQVRGPQVWGIRWAEDQCCYAWGNLWTWDVSGMSVWVCGYFQWALSCISRQVGDLWGR